MSVSLWGVALDFLHAVLVAVVVGWVVGVLNLRVRAALKDSAASTAISFVAPFVAFAPAEHLGASGLVAAVTAGLITGQGSARFLRAQDRLSERSNWATVEVLLEGGVFLLMGYELFRALLDGRARRARLDRERALARRRRHRDRPAAAQRVRRGPALTRPLAPDPAGERERIAVLEERLKEQEEHPETQRGPVNPAHRAAAELARRVTQHLADIDYLAASPLRRREGAVLVWAGMRGAVTVAAAQTLPETGTPHRSLLVLVAFVVAGGSLLVQGGTLPRVVRKVGVGASCLPDNDPERADLLQALSQAAVALLLDDPALVRQDGSPYNQRLLDGMRAMSVRRAADFATDEPRSVTDQMLELQAGRHQGSARGSAAGAVRRHVQLGHAQRRPGDP